MAAILGGDLMKIALCVVATGKYHGFLEPLLESARRYFCCEHTVDFHIFSDHSFSGQNVIYWPAIHQEWPGPTLARFSTMLTAKDHLSNYDYIYAIDADMRFSAPVGNEIFGKLVATLHPWYHRKPVTLIQKAICTVFPHRFMKKRSAYTYETRPESRAYISPDKGLHYFCGGFHGGQPLYWLAAIETMASWLQDDLSRGITPVWHDESAWNRYLIDHEPDVILPSEYCCPETHMLKDRKILALDKNHAAFRTIVKP